MSIPKLIMFDLDGTLAESKQPITTPMAERLAELLAKTRIAVISGGALPQFLSQVVGQLPSETNLSNLYLLPTSGASLYEYDNGGWKKIYEERLTEKEAQHIEEVIRNAGTTLKLIDFSQPAYGERIEHRGAQVTLSALGQQAPIDEKMAWDPDRTKRSALHAHISMHLPTFSVKIGGKTSIDVTKQNIDKAYGIHKLCERIGVSESDTLYIGDELRSGGNDEAAYKTDVETRSVTDPEDTMKFIRELVS